MDVSTHKLLESATIRTLHGQNFSRSSTEATHVLTDLLSRYLTVLSQSCKKYAEQAGRLNLTVRDAGCALEEMGTSIEELRDYCGSEGKELGRYGVQTRNRLEDLKEYKAVLSEGLRQEYDAIPLVYAPVPEGLSLSEGESEELDEESAESGDEQVTPEAQVNPVLNEDETEATQKDESLSAPSGPRRPSSPPLPLSPVSNPASPPARKRQRMMDWDPPEYVPDFLPPFPGELHPPSREPSPRPAAESATAGAEPLPTPLTQPLTSASSSDYLTPVPYSESSLSSVPEWHLPKPPSSPGLETSHSRPFVLPTPQIQPTLLAAYHHILTHPPPPTTGGGNPSKHKVALALIAENQRRPRWDPPDTLYASVQPCPPRVAAIMPTYPVPINAPPTPTEGKGDKTPDPNKEKKSGLPSAPPKPVAPTERIAPMISQQSSRIPELARQILPSSVYTRTTRLTHPPVLMKGTQKLTYGPGMNAPWNSMAAPTPAGGKAKDKDKDKEPEEKDEAPKVLPDARFYATWDYEPKVFWDPIRGIPKRARQGSIQVGGSNAHGGSRGTKRAHGD
ncbi:hypothetical protein GLOTRDRAFT_76055 [Gloeophyllum trabeum ATCC 11539]|uniref:Bromodomain associated domain-containing protein n=1 Tax=Gloeophyllum trabeum (strain ATCC 11539 / FP-39264 / Madison 617) TaxID=670483 RepID=S7Q8T5_GLOTA|nr:uncharacterized protein GLOTRDRAFT_76055 [Gloeophyllum trabeum ATCC 11539]EPQ55838.1 hypothetical protein GLOTRDRAFT_76055 [Gloeophyllum trabeum ATCC 11539]